MSVVLDLTVSAAEILDAVVLMDKSPAYAAFKEEIEKILTEFNKTGRFGDAAEIDVKWLVENSSDAVRNMHRAFLIWTFNEEKTVLHIKDSQYYTYLKLFFKGQENYLVSLNGGKKSVDSKDISDFKAKYISEIGTNPDLFNSLKEFFAGYVYGYFFNYLNEQAIMRDYAEFLVCLGIMSNKVSVSETTKMKILPKMAMLLNNDRFKYISGEIPISVMLDIVYSRFDKKNLSGDEDIRLKQTLRDYIVTNYSYQEDDGLVIDNVTESIMTTLVSEYIYAPDFSSDFYMNTFDGKRTFLDADKTDTGIFTSEKVKQVVSDKCRENYNDYFCSDREAVIEVGINAGAVGYRYPLTYLDGKNFWFADIYKVLMFPACDRSIYVSVDENDLPVKTFPFAGPALKTNIIRILGGLNTEGFTIRSDKRDALVLINSLPQTKNLSDEDKKMKALEILLYIISGNMDCVSYHKLLHENVFGTGLYEDYIRYRMECIFSRGMQSLEAKKNLLDEINRIK